MKKLYSIVLMAAALLVSTNMWAQVTVAYNSGSYAQNPKQFTGASALQQAINSINPGDTATITLNATQVLNEGIVIPSITSTTVADADKVVNRAKQRICINLNGYDINMADGVTHANISLVKGVLRLTGTGTIARKENRNKTWGNFGRGAIMVSGADGNKNYPGSSVDRSHEEWSVLYIDENVRVQATGTDKDTYGIGVNELDWDGNVVYPGWALAKEAIGYSSRYRTGYYGDSLPMWKGTDQFSAFGVKLMIAGTVYGQARGINIAGNFNQTPFDVENGRTTRKYDHYPYYDHHFPYIYVAPTAEIYCDADGVENNGNGGIYAGGWSVIDVSGAVHGQTGIMVVSGDLKVIEGNVYSDCPTGVNNGEYHSTSSGSGIFITSRPNYSGQSSVTVEGDSHIAGNGGSAIVDVLASGAGNSAVNHLNINGGTIEGGNQGAINITTSTGAHTEITSTTIEHNSNNPIITVGGVEVNVSTLVPAGTHTTVVEDADGNAITVVSKGDAPTGQENVAGHAGESVNWKHNDASTAAMTETISADYTLAELEINQDYSQTLTIEEGATFTVGRVVLGANAQIIVEPGAKFIVSGAEGIVAPVAENIVLQANNLQQAVFLFNPAVTSNRHPNAKVEMTAKNIGLKGGSYYWHRFAMPVEHATSWEKSGDLSGTTYPTYLYGWDYSTNHWLKLPGGVSDMTPFNGYTLSLASEEITPQPTELQNVKYTFSGTLLGNTDNNLQFIQSGWHYFGNSFTGAVSIKKIIDLLLGDNKLEGTVWVWDAEHQRYSEVPLNDLNEHPGDYDAYQQEIAPMHTFIMRKVEAGTSKTVLKYKTAVWENPTYNPAPLRRTEGSKSTSMRVVITAANGQSDVVRLVENSNRSDAFDNGYDASKFMTENTINAYVTIDDNDLATVTTDNLEGKAISLTTNNEVNYTMSFAKVNLDDYAVLDTETGAVITIDENNTYDFAAQPNATIEGRFEIVNIHRLPTAIDNTEVVKAVKGIYTITGQYVGENMEALPAGVYVVNGVKIVK